MNIQTTTPETEKPPLDKESSGVVVHRVVQPWWVEYPWLDYPSFGDAPLCVRCAATMKLNSPECEWGEGDDEIFNICNTCASELLREMWSRLNKELTD